MESDNEMMPPAVETIVTDNREWHIISESGPDRAPPEAMEETEATATTMLTVQKDLTVRDGMNVDRLLVNRWSKKSRGSALQHVKKALSTNQAEGVQWHHINRNLPAVSHLCDLWTDEDGGIYLRCHLTGDAANLLWTQSNA